MSGLLVCTLLMSTLLAAPVLADDASSQVEAADVDTASSVGQAEKGQPDDSSDGSVADTSDDASSPPASDASAPSEAGGDGEDATDASVPEQGTDTDASVSAEDPSSLPGSEASSAPEPEAGSEVDPAPPESTPEPEQATEPPEDTEPEQEVEQEAPAAELEADPVFEDGVAYCANADELETAINHVPTDGTPVTIVITQSFGVDREYSLYGGRQNVTLRSGPGGPFTITVLPDAYGVLFDIEGAYQLTIEDLILDGGGEAAFFAMDTIIAAHGNSAIYKPVVTLGAGAVIRNQWSRERGHVAALRNYAELVLDGGVITGNNGGYGDTYWDDAATVQVGNNAVFTMRSGSISNNISKQTVAVLVEKYGTFVMEGGSITGNTAIPHNEGFASVAVQCWGTAVLTGGEIAGNSLENPYNQALMAGDTSMVELGGDIVIGAEGSGERLYVSDLASVTIREGGFSEGARVNVGTYMYSWEANARPMVSKATAITEQEFAVFHYVPEVGQEQYRLRVGGKDGNILYLYLPGEVLEAPGWLSAEVDENGHIVLNWEAVDGATGYEVAWAGRWGFFDFDNACVEVAGTSHTFDDLPEKSYKFLVRAKTDEHMSPWSSAAYASIFYDEVYVSTAEEFADALLNAREDDQATTVIVENDITVFAGSGYDIGQNKNVLIKSAVGGPHTLALWLRVQPYATLTLEDIIVDGGGFYEDILTIETRAHATLGVGAVLQGEEYRAVYNQGTFVMDGGIIRDVETGVDNQSRFILRDGKIKDVEYTCVYNSGQFTMDGGTLVPGDGWVAVQNISGIVELNAGTLKGEDGSWYGIHDYYNSAEVVMTGGEISGFTEAGIRTG
ncbi:MAG: hypothetical protein AB7V55_07060, partial [Oscillospiraceae bacterium]